MIFHSDRGSEYVSRRYRRTCRKLGVTQSMSRIGSCFDNAVGEAFNSVLKAEYIHRHTFTSHRRPTEDRHLDHRLLQRPPTTRHVRVPEPDRPRTRPPNQL
ncbi:DDE-type integrase/transposase/recombinase [Streptomyces sp. NPDC020801]|uniref:DDE-type integrase/transposase/recombinase n=1 Tax=Streptomyces sp. NPDC020801 TaxID=3365093 RepID=UPI00378E5A43